MIYDCAEYTIFDGFESKNPYKVQFGAVYTGTLSIVIK